MTGGANEPTGQARPVPEARIHAFLYHEADLIDAQDWRGWGDLFTPDGVYWVPARAGQTDPLGEVSLIYDTPLLRRIRLERFVNNDACSLEPGFASTHHVSNVAVASCSPDGRSCTVHSRLIVGQWTPARQETFHARCTHQLEVSATGEIRIAMKRIDLLGAAGPLGDILTLL